MIRGVILVRCATARTVEKKQIPEGNDRKDGKGNDAAVEADLAGEVELGYFKVAGLGDFEVSRGSLDDEDGDVGALEEAGLVGASELIGCSFSESPAEEGDGRTLRRLGVDDELAGNGGGDEGAVGGALDLLDGVDGRCGDDRGAVLFNGDNGPLDGGGVDERADGVVNENDVLGAGGGKLGESVGDRLLAIVAADDDVDFARQAMLGEHGGDARLLRVAHCDVDAGDGRDVQEGPQGVDQNRKALELEKLLGHATRCVGHAGADTGGGDDDEDRHGKRSITLLGVGSRA